MLNHKLKLGSFTIFLNVCTTGAEVNFTISGSLWKKINQLKNRLQKRHERPLSIKSAEKMRPTSVHMTQTLDDEMKQNINQHTWYHSYNINNKIQIKGEFDHNPILHMYQLPEDLTGKTVLDVATFDGFWAFEFEKRGAEKVIALDLEKASDIDWPPHQLKDTTDEMRSFKFGNGFRIMKKLLHSNVERVACNVYDLTPEKFGMFDIVHAGDFLLHLNSPVKALQNIASVCKEYAIISDVYFPELESFGERHLMEYMGGESDFTWWKISASTLKKMIYDAGFSRVETAAQFAYGPREHPTGIKHVVFKAYK